MNLTLAESKAIDAANQSNDEAATAEKMTNFDADMRSSELDVTGPLPVSANNPVGYDYAEAYASGTPLTAEGDLPNKHIKGVYLAGRDMATGEQMQGRNDPDGFGIKGIKAFGESWTNPRTGVPPETADSVVSLALEHRQNGGTARDFNAPVPQEMRDQANGTVDALQNIRGVENSLNNAPEPEAAAMPTEPAEVITVEMLNQDPEWLDTLKVLAEHEGYEAADDAELLEAGLEEAAGIVASPWKMATLIYAAESGDMSPEVTQAYITLLQKYEGLDWWEAAKSADVWQASVINTVFDPTTWATGGLGALAYKTVGKKAAQHMFVQRLINATGGKLGVAAGVGAAAGGAEGGIYGGITEATDQALRGKEYEWGVIASEAGWGAVGGAIIGAPFGAALSEPGRKGIMGAYKHVANNYADMRAVVPGSPAAQRGSLSFRDTRRALGLPHKTTDFGVRIADTTAGGSEYYSRMVRYISGDGAVPGAWAGAFGKKPVDALRALDMLDSWQQKPKGEGFSEYEVENSGLRFFLEDKVSRGEKVSSEEVDDYLFATAPRVNSLVSGVGDYLNRESKYYASGLDRPDVVVNETLHPHVQERLFDSKFISRTPEVEAQIEQVNLQTDSYVSALDDWADDASKIMSDMRQFPGSVSLDDPIVKSRMKPPVAPEGVGGAHSAVLAKYAKGVETYAMGDPEGPVLVMPDKPKAYDGADIADTGAVETTNRLTGESRTHPDQSVADSAMYHETRKLIADMPREGRVNIVRQLDEAELLRPTAWGRVGVAGKNKDSLTITGGENQSNYQEMRLHLPHEVMGDDTVSRGRFNKSFDELSDGEKKRVTRIQGHQQQRVPGEVFSAEYHYPLEANLLAHIRTQDLLLPDGSSVRAVNELQSDMSQAQLALHPLEEGVEEGFSKRAAAFRESMKGEDRAWVDRVVGTIEGNTDLADAMGGPDFDFVQLNEILMPSAASKPPTAKQITAVKKLFSKAPPQEAASWQPKEGWEMLSLNRIIQQAVKDGHGAVALPIDDKMIARIEQWDKGKESKGVLGFYAQLARKVKKDKKFLKRWGIKLETKKVHRMTDAGKEEYENMLILKIDQKTASKGDKAIYGTGAIATTLGAKMMDEEQLEDGDI